MAKIRYINGFDITNGFWGTSVSVWFQGCEHMCKNCFNPETWNYFDDSVKEKDNKKVAKEILIELDKYFPKTLTFLGGDPMAKYNRNDLYEIIKIIKKEKPNLKIAMWTGYTFNQIKNDRVVPLIDVIVDGEYIEEFHCDYKITKDKRDKYRGSTNQRIIDVQASLKQNKIITYNK